MRFPNLLAEPGTPAELFVSRYKWLSRWALQFARNDRAIAEDLIQETFVRFSQANLQVGEVRDAEGLLYTYLQHVHLAHMREVSRHSFISLADAKLDALALGQLTGPDVDRIETQNVLRRIAAYVAWRKQTSKSASIVGLRFFHGYLPEEIARIALVSREAVDERLHNGRSEIRLHLLDAEKLRQIQHGGPVEIFPFKVVIPTDEFLRELHNQLFHASHGVCMPAEQLVARYRKSPDVPVRRDLLAHIVSCPKCLALVDQISRQNKGFHGSGSGGGLTGVERRGSRPELPLSSAREMENVVRRAERRLKEIFEHRPTSLIVAVNGEILASRDIRASFNWLKVEVLNRDLKFIEILNEYGVSLLSWAVESTPPHCDPVLHRVAQFSMGRRLGVDVQFSAQKLVIEVHYDDPSYGVIPSPSLATAAEISNEEDEREEGPVKSGNQCLTTFGVPLLKVGRNFRLTPLIATGMVCAVILAIIFILGSQRSSRVRPTEFLQRAAAWEKQNVQSANSGVILQQVTIRSKQGVFERSIYRDPEGKRHLKRQPLDENNMRLKQRLAEAGISWDAPLSATSFQEWEAHSHVMSESVRSVGDQLLMLRVETDGGEVERETLTIRAGDFHPISRTAEFRDVGTVEIAELSYAVVPWATVNQDLFESNGSTSGPLSTTPRSVPIPQRQSPISDVELDLAELELRTALHQLNADFTDRLTILRSSTEVKISGLVEDDRQKLDLQHRLRLIPHVSTNLKTVHDASEHLDEAVPPTSVRVASVVAEPSLLENFLLEQGRAREVASDLADRLFTASTAMLRSRKALLQLQERFPHDTLSSDALDVYNGLLFSLYGEFDTALRQELDAIQQTGIQIPPDQAGRSGPLDMNAGIEKNRALLKELIGHDAPDTRTAPAVLTDLARTVESLSIAANQEQGKIYQTTSSEDPPQQISTPH